MDASDISLGENARSDLKARAEELADVLDEIADLQERAKEIKADAKSEGYDMKAFNQIVKEARRGPEYQAAQLTLELVVDTYRGAVGLPRDVETAQASVRANASEEPTGKKSARSGLPAKAGIREARSERASEQPPAKKKGLN